jgi:hypothetical protein
MLVPTVALSFQQAAAFISAGFMEEGWEVACHNSDCQLDSSSWRGTARATRVTVMTAGVGGWAAGNASSAVYCSTSVCTVGSVQHCQQLVSCQVFNHMCPELIMSTNSDAPAVGQMSCFVQAVARHRPMHGPPLCHYGALSATRCCHL